MGKIWILQAIALALMLMITLVNALATAPNNSNSSRRSFLNQKTTVAAALFGGAFLLLPHSAANAYERRDVGGTDRSAATAAYNDAAYQTNNRLERDGFKLDTRDEEKARLSEAMSSFTYESSSSSSKTKTGSKNSGSSASNASKTNVQK